MAFGDRQRSVFCGIGRQLVHDDGKHLRESGPGKKRRAANADAFAKSAQLGVYDLTDRRSATRAGSNEFLGTRQCLQAA